MEKEKEWRHTDTFMDTARTFEFHRECMDQCFGPSILELIDIFLFQFRRSLKPETGEQQQQSVR